MIETIVYNIFYIKDRKLNELNGTLNIEKRESIDENILFDTIIEESHCNYLEPEKIVNIKYSIDGYIWKTIYWREQYIISYLSKDGIFAAFMEIEKNIINNISKEELKDLLFFAVKAQNKQYKTNIEENDIISTSCIDKESFYYIEKYRTFFEVSFYCEGNLHFIDLNFSNKATKNNTDKNTIWVNVALAITLYKEKYNLIYSSHKLNKIEISYNKTDWFEFKL